MGYFFMKNITLFAIIFCVLIAGATSFVFFNPTDKTQPPVTSNTVADTKDVQKVILGIKDSNYYPNTIKVKAGQPVSIFIDSSVTGCLRSFVIRDLGVSGVARTPQDAITFTPPQKGTYAFACSMGMGHGTLIVE